MSLSEIRVNTTKTRTGVGTITYTETGPVITGIATASNFKTGSTNVHSTGVELANINTGGSTATFGGDLSIPDTIVHTGDTNTKIRFPSADTISFETSGTQRFDINSSGHLKIGTAAAAGGRLYFESTSGAAQYIASGGTNNQDLLVANSAGEKLRITSDGELLVGTTTDNGFKFKVSDGGASEFAFAPNDLSLIHI